MLTSYDIIAHGPQGLVAVFQTHSGTGTTKEWAAEFRANLSAHVGLPDSRYFAILTPDKLYLWTQGTPPDALPTFEVDVLPILEPYYARIGATAGKMGPLVFDSVMASWLDEVAYFPSPESTRGLEHTGFVEAMRNADVDLGDAA
jgi:hypothetical protein